MRSGIHLVVVAVLIGSAGCTHIALERRTVKQAGTLTDLQYKQVLDNLAMFAGNPEAMPWHVKVTGGLVQIADQGDAAFGAGFGAVLEARTGSVFNHSVGAQRGIVGQWDVDPATDPDELEMLHLAYRKAVRPDDPFLRQEILEKICELSVRFDLLPQKKTIQSILTETKEGGEGLETLDRLIAGLISEVLAAPCGTKKDMERARCAQNFKRYQVEELLSLIPDRVSANDGGWENKVTELIKKAKHKNDKLKLEDRELARRWVPVLKDKIEQLEKTGADSTRIVELNQWRCELKTIGTKPTTPGNATPAQQLQNFRLQKLAITRRGKGETVDRGQQEESDTILRILTAVHDACAPGYLPRTDIKWETERNAALIDQAEDKIRKLEKLLDPMSPFQTPWLHCGQKKDVPKCACYVGHYRDCLGDRYVWVTPDGLKTLREFTLVILTLAPIEKQDVISGRGAAFSPTLR